MTDIDLLLITLAGGALVLLIARVATAIEDRRPRTCRHCGHVGRPEVQDGSLAVEIVLWLFCCAAGMAYSLHRISSRRLACADCGRRAGGVAKPV
jgi:hypothetical protein